MYNIIVTINRRAVEVVEADVRKQQILQPVLTGREIYLEDIKSYNILPI
jgi:hypothetical protein